MEAVACGCPVVLSDIPSHREILDESCARFVDPSDIQRSADTIVQTLSNEDTSKGHALIAKKKAQGWSIAEMAQNYERVYKEIIQAYIQ